MTEDVKIEQPVQATIAKNESTQPQQTPQGENVEEINWRKFRQQREEERKQREAAEQYARKKEEETNALKAAMEALVNKPATRNEEVELSDDERIEKKVQAALYKHSQDAERLRAEKDKVELPQKLQSTFRDFNDICTTENLDYLEYHYPEVARPYKHMPDGYDKWEGIYHALKRFIPNKDSKKDMDKADKNLAKPQAMSKPGMSKTGDHAPTAALDDKKRADNWARMQKIIKGV